MLLVRQQEGHLASQNLLRQFRLISFSVTLTGLNLEKRMVRRKLM